MDETTSKKVLALSLHSVYYAITVIAGAAPRDRRKSMKTIKVPQTYVPARAVAPEDLALCQTFDSREPGSREVLAHLPLNKEVRLIEPVEMRFFEGGRIALEGRVTLTRRGSPASYGEVELL